MVPDYYDIDNNLRSDDDMADLKQVCICNFAAAFATVCTAVPHVLGVDVLDTGSVTDSLLLPAAGCPTHVGPLATTLDSGVTAYDWKSSSHICIPEARLGIPLRCPGCQCTVCACASPRGSWWSAGCDFRCVHSFVWEDSVILCRCLLMCPGQHQMCLSSSRSLCRMRYGGCCTSGESGIPLAATCRGLMTLSRPSLPCFYRSSLTPRT
jgi:hypothetical protein